MATRLSSEAEDCSVSSCLQEVFLALALFARFAKHSVLLLFGILEVHLIPGAVVPPICSSRSRDILVHPSPCSISSAAAFLSAPV